ncbi:hypothetical protein AB0A70_35235 [Streptomyces morookaense]|uniref:hypothetical protein n=1 Tax=Streptomyces morookaense TaxID=1970 RepID=UPI0033CB4BD5
MPSVLGLLEAREKKVREEVARLREEALRVQAALDAAECALQRLADARETVTEVLAEPHAEETSPAAAAGSMVPRRAGGTGVEVLAPEYQRIMSLLTVPEAADGLRAKQIALALGGPVAPARVEGVRSKLKRLAARGWAAEVEPGLFSTVTATVSAAA